MDKEPMSTQREREEREGGLQGSTKNAGEAVTSRIEWMMPAKPWGAARFLQHWTTLGVRLPQNATSGRFQYKLPRHPL